MKGEIPIPLLSDRRQHSRHCRRGPPQPVRVHRGLRQPHVRAALPNASFLGFTGTPIELEDANTRAVFGDYISVYDIQRSEEDKGYSPHLL